MDLFLCLQFPRSDAKSHSQTQIERHLNLALRGLEATQHQVSDLVSVVKDQSQQIQRQSNQIERQSGQIERLISKDKEQSEKIERLISTVQGQSLERERRGPINQIPPIPFEWEIKPFDIAFSQILVSKPFYLFERGYKYLLQIKARSSIFPIPLEVYIKVVPGEFDELLSWPCKEKVRVTGTNQDLEEVCVTNQDQWQRAKCPSNVIDFEKCREPYFRPLNDDHHEYCLVLEITVGFGTILITVNRE